MSRSLIVYIATSLDGFIADPNGGIAFLDNTVREIPDEDFGYNDFYSSCDTTIMGAETYRHVKGMDVPFPYQRTKNYVFTRSGNIPVDPFIIAVKDDPIQFTKTLLSQPGNNIWLVGGGELNRQFLEAGLIDEVLLFTLPVFLGKGIHIFGGTSSEKHLKYSAVRAYPNGMVQYTLTRRV